MTGSGSTPLPWSPPFSALPVADDRHQAEIGQLLILVERPVLPLQEVLRIRHVYPGSRILFFTHPGSRISVPGSNKQQQKRGVKKISFHTFLCSHKFHKIENYFSFVVLKC